MLKTVKIISIIILALGLYQANFAQSQKQDKNILILFSLVPSTPAYRIMTDGIRTSLNEVYGDAYNLHIEYLETERFPKGQYPGEKFDPINEKYNEIELDLLICVGIGIISTIKEHAGAHLLNLPTISIDYEFPLINYHNDITLNDKTTEMNLTINAGKIISTALSVFPDAASVCFICGSSYFDNLFCLASQEGIKSNSRDLNIAFLSDLSMDEALNTVRNLPENSIVIIPNFIADSKKVPYYNPEAVRLISKSANAPVFSYTDLGFGQGAIGGYTLSFKKVSRLLGESAVKILDGTDPNTIIVNESDYYEYLFDWRELKRWNLVGSDLLPKECRIMFEEISFFAKYRLLIILAVIFTVIQTLLIVNLVRLYRKQSLITRQLIETENKTRELVRQDRILRLGQLTASLSHELNQPLTAILSTAQAGLRFVDSGKPDPEFLKEIFRNIVEDDKRTAAILNSIRGMMKLEKREKERVNLNAIIEELIPICHSESVEKNITLVLNLPDHPVYIFADRIQIQQVLLNFISNASQSIEQSKATNRNLIIHVSVDNDHVNVSVRDYGAGIDESLKDRIFKPFVTSKKEGTGIGLAISHSVIDDHQGKIWAENMPGGGAQFSFSLKIYQDEQGEL